MYSARDPSPAQHIRALSSEAQPKVSLKTPKRLKIDVPTLKTNPRRLQLSSGFRKQCETEVQRKVTSQIAHLIRYETTKAFLKASDTHLHLHGRSSVHAQHQNQDNTEHSHFSGDARCRSVQRSIASVLSLHVLCHL